MGQHERAEQTLLFWPGPIGFGVEWPVALLRNVERAPAPYPTFDQVRMNLAGLLERKIALADRAEAFGAEAHFLFERRGREQLRHPVVHLVVEGGVDSMAGQDREADLV